MAAPFVVRDYQRLDSPQGETIRATLDGDPVWFRGEALADAPESGDPFLAIGLLPAMQAGRDLDLTALPGISPRLLTALDRVQEIWTCWNPELHRIQVAATPRATPPPARTSGLTFFSGGVDAIHAVLPRRDQGEWLVFLNGFDFAMSPEAFASATDRVRRAADRLGGQLVTLETNWIAFTRQQRQARAMSHGGCLAAVAHLLVPERATIAASNSWARLTPWGTHPLLDPHWSTETTTIEHAGSDARRTEKVAAVAEDPELLAALWVCHADPLRNCGRCAKCARTAAMLQLLGHRTAAFGDLDHAVERYLRLVPASREWIYLEEIRRLAGTHGTPTQVAAIDRAERAMERRAALRELAALALPRRRRDHEDDLNPWGRGPTPRA